jgi:hypothetical protein
MVQKYRTGDIVEHVLSKDWLIVLQYDEYSNRYLCRTKDLREVILYTFELTSPKTQSK